MPYMPSTVDIDPKAAKTVQNGYQARFERVKAFIASKEESSDLEDDEMSQGRKVEMEHTSDPKEAEKIAKDHLKETPDYYSKLKSAGLDKSLTKLKHYLVYPHLGLKVELKTLKDYLNA